MNDENELRDITIEANKLGAGCSRCSSDEFEYQLFMPVNGLAIGFKTLDSMRLFLAIHPGGFREKVCKKPPLGLRPAFCAYEDRQDEIIAAISRYSSEGVAVPVEWVEELKAVRQLAHRERVIRK